MRDSRNLAFAFSCMSVLCFWHSPYFIEYHVRKTALYPHSAVCLGRNRLRPKQSTLGRRCCGDSIHSIASASFVSVQYRRRFRAAGGPLIYTRTSRYVPGSPSDLNTGNRIESATGCPSWCRPLRPLFHFLCSILFIHRVHYCQPNIDYL